MSHQVFFLNNILGLHTARVPQDGLLFNLTRNLIMVQNNNVHFIFTKTYRSMFTLDEKEINIGYNNQHGTVSHVKKSW